MAKEYSLIKNGVVVNRIVADEKFIEAIANQYDTVTDDPKAKMGHLWDGNSYSPGPAKEKPKQTTMADVMSKLAEIEAKLTAMSETKAGV